MSNDNYSRGGGVSHDADNTPDALTRRAARQRSIDALKAAICTCGHSEYDHAADTQQCLASIQVATSEFEDCICFAFEAR